MLHKFQEDSSISISTWLNITLDIYYLVHKMHGFLCRRIVGAAEGSASSATQCNVVLCQRWERAEEMIHSLICGTVLSVPPNRGKPRKGCCALLSDWLYLCLAYIVCNVLTPFSATESSYFDFELQMKSFFSFILLVQSFPPLAPVSYIGLALVWVFFENFVVIFSPVCPRTYLY